MRSHRHHELDEHVPQRSHGKRLLQQKRIQRHKLPVSADQRDLPSAEDNEPLLLGRVKRVQRNDRGRGKRGLRRAQATKLAANRTNTLKYTYNTDGTISSSTDADGHKT